MLDLDKLLGGHQSGRVGRRILPQQVHVDDLVAVAALRRDDFVPRDLESLRRRRLGLLALALAGFYVPSKGSSPSCWMPSSNGDVGP